MKTSELNTQTKYRRLSTQTSMEKNTKEETGHFNQLHRYTRVLLKTF